MGDLDIGMAMVEARIESSRPGKEREDWNNRENKVPHHDPWRGSDQRKPSLPGVNMEVINGKLILIPSGDLPRHKRKKGWKLTQEEGSVIRFDTGEVVQPQERK
jgi:hypothetical protein